MPQVLNNRYQVIQSFGDPGGFGQTFLAIDIHMPSKRKCVVKQFKPAQKLDSYTHKIIQERFEREAAILEKLGDSNSQIPKLYAYFAEGDDFYIVQELIEGKTLMMKVRDEGVLNERTVLEILVNILPVLEFAHKENIIHRDIKPANIILRNADAKPVLIDFGAVKEIVTTVIDAHGTPVTPSIGIGTKGYTPLEQWAGQPVFASDLYSLSLTAVFLMTGKHPQEMTDLSTGEIEWKRYLSSVSLDFISILDIATHQDYRARYARAREMLVALLSIKENKSVENKAVISHHKITNNQAISVSADRERIPSDSEDLAPTLPYAESNDIEPTVLNLKRFKFDMIFIDREGSTLKRYKGRARYFTEYLNDEVELEMVYVPTGTFMMGSHKGETGRGASESPQHQVTVQGFCIGKYQVTQLQWKAVALLPKVRRNLNPDPSWFKGNNLPVERVSWKDAVEFCARVSKLTGREYRLPSEAEWEYACRAGTSTPYSFGPIIKKELANFNGLSNCTIEVGSLGIANKFGLCDMHGNVYEWCIDIWHENYIEAPSDGSAWEDDGQLGFRIRRGGSWQSNMYACRSARRSMARPHLRDVATGVRIVSAF